MIVRGVFMRRMYLVPLLFFLALFPLNGKNIQDIPEDFPQFKVPGQMQKMESLRSLYWLHYPEVAHAPTLWDEWLVAPTLWPAVKDGEGSRIIRNQWQERLGNRSVDEEGYVSSHQGPSIAHPQGWPFPAWNHGKGGWGWHFSFKNMASPPYPGDELTTQTGWIPDGIQDKGMNENGWNLVLVRENAVITTEQHSFETSQSPFIQISWCATGLGNIQPYIQWITTEDKEFSFERRMFFDPVECTRPVVSLIPLYKHPKWTGTITQLRICFANQKRDIPVIFQALFTTYDTRHNVNSQSFISGCSSYFWWTRDLNFLRKNMNRMRLALRHLMVEHNTQKEKVVHTPWVGHDGRPGFQRESDGTKNILYGRGIGNNYWDLIPFGGKDAYATIRYYSSLQKMAVLEREILRHPEWNIPTSPLRFDPAELLAHAQEVKETGNRIFWNPETGRFVACIDINGKKYDYGFTFLNLEAIYYDFATEEHTRMIMDWICGDRTVKGDTSQGADIYHWRFAPRITTRRNVDYYYWAWNVPDMIPWGEQIQDGGAVLGFSYHDLMSRLKSRSPEDSWKRLQEIIAWFDDVQAAGGYRSYYNGKREGTLQGNGVAGGLGMDSEFTESMLLPQVILEGFLGFAPTGDGFRLNPKLPSDWTELSVSQIYFHDIILDIKVMRDTIKLSKKNYSEEPLYIQLPEGAWEIIYILPSGSSSAPSPAKKRKEDGAVELVWSNADSVIFKSIKTRK